MGWLWIGLSALAALAGLRYLARLRATRAPTGVPPVDDAALHAILHTGRLQARETDSPLDMRDAADAEDEFWSETWDEPEEYPR